MFKGVWSDMLIYALLEQEWRDQCHGPAPPTLEA